MNLVPISGRIGRAADWPVKTHNWGEADMQEKEEYEYELTLAKSRVVFFEDQERVIE